MRVYVFGVVLVVCREHNTSRLYRVSEIDSEKLSFKLTSDQRARGNFTIGAKHVMVETLPSHSDPKKNGAEDSSPAPLP